MKQFNSSLATLKAQIKASSDSELAIAEETLKRQAKGNTVNFDKRIMALFARTKLLNESLDDVVIVDFFETFKHLSDDPSTVIAIAEDVGNWEELHFPFENFVLKITDNSALHVSTLYHDDDKEIKYYNIITLSEEDKFWYMTEAAFQIRFDNPGTTVFDQAYEALEPEKKGDVDDAVKGMYMIIASFAFMTAHNKLDIQKVEVPLSRNSKREKRNQPAYCEYKEAVLGNFRKEYVNKGEVLGGTHASPKMHLRRGHWRRKPRQQEKIWVRASVVGDPSKGIVIKEYKV